MIVIVLMFLSLRSSNGDQDQRGNEEQSTRMCAVKLRTGPVRIRHESISDCVKDAWAVCARVVSVGSDLETLGWPGCEGKKASSRGKIGPFVRNYRIRYYARKPGDELLCWKAEDRAPPSTLTWTVTAACRVAVVRIFVMIGGLVICSSHSVRAIMSSRRTGAMHRAGNHRNSRTAQRRHPRRE